MALFVLLEKAELVLTNFYWKSTHSGNKSHVVYKLMGYPFAEVCHVSTKCSIH